MKLFLIFILAFGIALGQVSYAGGVTAPACRVYTPEQEYVLGMSAFKGSQHDLSLTLAAIVQQESFVGPYIVRENPNDNYLAKRKDGTKYSIRGSYGITHVLLATAMWLEGEHNLWRARATIVPELINNDEYAIELAIKKLQSVEREGQTWRQLVAKYNGAGEAAEKYATKIAEHVKEFRRCGVVEGILEQSPVDLFIFGKYRWDIYQYEES